MWQESGSLVRLHLAQGGCNVPPPRCPRRVPRRVSSRCDPPIPPPASTLPHSPCRSLRSPSSPMRPPSRSSPWSLTPPPMAPGPVSFPPPSPLPPPLTGTRGRCGPAHHHIRCTAGAQMAPQCGCLHLFSASPSPPPPPVCAWAIAFLPPVVFIPWFALPELAVKFRAPTDLQAGPGCCPGSPPVNIFQPPLPSAEC